MIMRIFFIIFAVALAAFTAEARTGMDVSSANDGTYKTAPVTSGQACAELCRADDKCRGSVTYQPDTRYPEMECRLNDGMNASSPFHVKPPEPLDIAAALEDFNAYRAGLGLSPVVLNAALIEASDRHARDLAKHGIAAHEGTDGSAHDGRASDAGYAYSLIAENVATGQKSWDAVFKAWQKSPGHNENLLQPDVTDFGIALVYEPTTKYITYWAMLVGAPPKTGFR